MKYQFDKAQVDLRFRLQREEVLDRAVDRSIFLDFDDISPMKVWRGEK